MTDLAVNGHGVLRGTVSLPRIGRWTADLRIDTGETVSGIVSVSSSDDALSLRGTVRRGGAYSEVGHLYVIGGAGGLESEVPPVFYRSVTLQTPLQALLSAVGETLSVTTDTGVLGTFLPTWTRERGFGGPLLARLAEAAEASWRTLDDGTIWLGHETWPDAGIADDAYELLQSVPSERRDKIVTEAVPATLRPGTTFRGQRVAYVEYEVYRDVTTTVWYEREAPSSHPIRGPLDSVIADATRATRYHALFTARVIAQRDDDSLDVVLDDESFPPMTQVPLTKFAPGVKHRVAVGSKVHVGFQDSDPSKPVALPFASGTTLEIPVKTCGTLAFSVTPLNTLVITYTNPDGQSTQVSVAFAIVAGAIQISLVPPTPSMALKGRIAT